MKGRREGEVLKGVLWGPGPRYPIPTGNSSLRCSGSSTSPSCYQELRRQLPPSPVAGGGGEIEQPQGAAAGEWGGICVLSKQQPPCSVAASSLINQPQPNVLAFPPPQGDWGWARVPRGVRWGWLGDEGVVLGFPSLGLVLSSPGSSMHHGMTLLALNHREGISYKSPVGVCWWGGWGEEG